MNYKQIEELLQYNDNESKIFIPNEILVDLKDNISSSPHLGFAYSYYYLISWLYRHSKYLYKDQLIDNGKIKEILGYNPKSREVDRLIKKNGLLDSAGYTEATKDIPIAWLYDKFEGLSFDRLSDMDETFQEIITKNLSRKYFIKYPVKAFHRYPLDDELKEEYNNGYEDGTFFDINNTHCIPFEVFMYCMDNENISTIGFYLYSYIKRMNDIYPAGWDVSIENMVIETGLSENTLLKYLDQLRKYKMVEAIHNQEYFCLALDAKERKANTYISNDFELFQDKPKPYKKMKVLTSYEYYKMRKEQQRETWGDKSDISIEELPY